MKVLKLYKKDTEIDKGYEHNNLISCSTPAQNENITKEKLNHKIINLLYILKIIFVIL